MVPPAQRRWTPLAVPDLARTAEGVILFDGVCVFCSRWVRFVFERDAAARLRFSDVQSPFGEALARRLGIDPVEPETNAVVLGGRAYFKADVAIQVLRRLPRRAWAAWAIRLLPRPLRDRLYDIVARNRYAWFGRTDTCLVPATTALARRIVRDATPETMRPRPPLFARALGDAAFAALPAALRAVHAPLASPPLVLVGEAEVDGAATTAGWFVAALFRLPRRAAANRRIPVQVTIEPLPDGGERWTRDFAGHRFATTLHLVPDGAGMLEERFRILTFRLDLPADADGLGMAVRTWRLGPLPLPRRLAPVAQAREDTDEHGRFRFDVTLSAPPLGRLVRYRGWLVPKGTDTVPSRPL
jgi:predicted DCC family thiol-disulfide oxidoreductase YuxK